MIEFRVVSSDQWDSQVNPNPSQQSVSVCRKLLLTAVLCLLTWLFPGLNSPTGRREEDCRRPAAPQLSRLVCE